jgi:lysophospholipase L1-like esterase
MSRAWRWLAMAVVLLLPAAAFPQSMTLCRAKPELLDLGTPLAAARKSIAERKQLRIIALGSSSTSGYGVSNPVYAYPSQLKMGLDKALPGIDVDVINRGIGGQDVEEMAVRLREEMQGNPASLVVWQTGTNAAIRHMPPDKFERWLRNGLALGKSLADFVLMNP